MGRQVAAVDFRAVAAGPDWPGDLRVREEIYLESPDAPLKAARVPLKAARSAHAHRFKRRVLLRRAS